MVSLIHFSREYGDCTRLLHVNATLYQTFIGLSFAFPTRRATLEVGVGRLREISVTEERGWPFLRVFVVRLSTTCGGRGDEVGECLRLD